MKHRRVAPVRLLLGAVLVAIIWLAAMLYFALSPPALGLTLAYDARLGGAVVMKSSRDLIPEGTVITTIEGGGDRLRLEARDFTIEPDGVFGPYADYYAFLGRQQALFDMLRNPDGKVTLADSAGGRWTISPRPDRPVSDLPVSFWVQMTVGIFAWLIAAGIWAFRSGDTSARYLLLSGFSTLMFAPFAAVYTTRELALPAGLFRWLDSLNFLGGSLFAASLVSLLLYYPRKIAPRWVGLTIVGVFIAWYVGQEVELLGPMNLARRLLVMAALLATFILSGAHWWLTRKDPVARAALQWFLLSWVITAGAFGLLVLLPQMFNIDTSAAQGYAFLLFLLLYVGLAFGILRYRLFDLGEWWLRVMIWILSLGALVVLDLLFVMGLQLSTGLSLGLALLIVGVVWLPLRGMLWARIFGRPGDSRSAVFQRVADIALTADPERQSQSWHQLIVDLFQPLRVEIAATQAVAIEGHGAVLEVPGAGPITGLRLEYAKGGRRLFSRKDADLAAELSGMLAHVIASRTAYEQGVAVERARIASDIHDNIGAHLMSALHSTGVERKDRLIRETFADLRNIINDASRGGTSLDEVLSDIRLETADRLEAGGLTLDWRGEAGDGGFLPAPVVRALRSILREAVNNVVKHAGATAVTVSIQKSDGMLALSVADNGAGMSGGERGSGHGLTSIAGRAKALDGTAEWRSGPEGRGVALVVELPLAR